MTDATHFSFDPLELHLNGAEAKAWEALERYDFRMFGYWASIWTTLNKAEGFNRRNPWTPYVKQARERSASTWTPEKKG